MRGLTVRAVLFACTADLIPLYALYAMLFADHGLSTAQISSLLAIWSATSFVLEIPSGAWADTVSRRALLIGSAALLVAAFSCWTLFPSYAGFALGFVLWGASGSLRSGTFEALLYDDLAARSATASYPRITGYVRAAAESGALVGILAAAPLYAWGGYPLIGWSSVAIAAVHTCTAAALPAAPKTVSAREIEDLADACLSDDGALPPAASSPLRSGGGPSLASDGGEPLRSAAGPPLSSGRAEAPQTGGDPADSRAGVRYLRMLRLGLRESLRVRMIRRGLLLAAMLNGITAFDEYFALLAGNAGVAPSITPLLVGLTVAGGLAGTALAGRTESMRPRTMAAALFLGGVLFIGGALLAGLAADHPDAVYVLTGVGFSAIGVAYGIDYNAEVVAAARLQDAIEGPARATVTSVGGFLTELLALAVFGFVGLASVWLPIPPTVALLGVPLLVIAALVPSWLPVRRDEAAAGSHDGGPIEAGP
ncbi:MFS transporter [Nocardia sp. NBC_01388]|uniref:MFS transporter n=1 Tax=Nocardia sp. NBC_01388 TaxID=2903596 RepID=UPI0032515335